MTDQIKLRNAMAEIERLTVALGPTAAEAWAHMYDEIERLRAALHAIANRERPSTARSMARRALEPKPIIAPCDDAEFGMKP